MKYTNFFAARITMAIIFLNISIYAIAKDTQKFQNINDQINAIVWHTLIDEQSWAYTLETILEKENGQKQQRVQKFNPALPTESQWQLLEHQYQPPSKQILFDYAQTRESLADEENITAGSEIIDIKSLRFLRQSSSHKVYAFTPSLPMFEKEDAMHFEGNLFVNRLSGQLDYLTISLANSFSPSFSVKLSRYNLKIELFNIDNAIHVSKIESHKEGKLLFVSEFNEKSTRRIYNFSKVKG